MKPIISVIILTRNEEIHIERAIRSLCPLAVKVFVVDSFSTDRTCKIAQELGADVVQHEFFNQSQQLQWALDTLPLETDWVMRLDADEILTSDLANEIACRLPKIPPEVTGVYLRLGYIFMSRRLRHGGRHLKLLRIFRKGAARVERRMMDERFVLLEDNVVVFKHMMFDHNLKDIAFFVDKHNNYATREMIEVLSQRYHLFHPQARGASMGPHFDMGAKRWIKQNMYDQMPLWVGPFVYFVYRYVIALGFLDGLEGLIYHFMQAFWYRFLVGAKIEELDRALYGLSDDDARRAEVAHYSGYPADSLFRS